MALNDIKSKNAMQDFWGKKSQYLFLNSLKKHPCSIWKKVSPQHAAELYTFFSLCGGFLHYALCSIAAFDPVGFIYESGYTTGLPV